MKNEINPKIGKRLTKARQHLGLRQDKMANMLNMVPSSLSRIETGLNMPSIKTLVTLANKCNISLDWLLLGKGVMFTENQDSADPRDTDTFETEALKMIDLMRQYPLLRYSIMSHYENFKLEHKEIFINQNL